MEGSDMRIVPAGWAPRAVRVNRAVFIPFGAPTVSYNPLGRTLDPLENDHERRNCLISRRPSFILND
jgi:hypothetical protein